MTFGDANHGSLMTISQKTMGCPWIADGVIVVGHGSPMGRPWANYGLPIVGHPLLYDSGLWVSHGSAMVYYDAMFVAHVSPMGLPWVQSVDSGVVAHGSPIHRLPMSPWVPVGRPWVSCWSSMGISSGPKTLHPWATYESRTKVPKYRTIMCIVVDHPWTIHGPPMSRQ